MLPVRIAFDASLPIVVSVPEMEMGGRRFVGGEAVPWRECGVDELTLYQWWRAGLVAFLPSSPSDAGPAALSSPEQAARPTGATRFDHRGNKRR